MADDDFTAQLNEWEHQVEDLVNLSADDKSKITAAGAAEFDKVLAAETPKSGIDYKVGKQAGHAKQKKRAHLDTTVTYKDGYTADNLHTGDTDVGFDGKYFAFVAAIVNNGRKRKMSSKELANMGFVQRAQEKAKPAVLAAMTAKYRELKGGD